ncbi:unnamed protein product [Caenorhabditis angaria]|uniref:Transmembrane protein n=1 Tax=Caenorhabditis angaria TaxID=860376 RepID=A0A9P1IBV8_9PELO|nr:unnamed protein product [Caenorhabditis angaria]
MTIPNIYTKQNQDVEIAIDPPTKPNCGARVLRFLASLVSTNEYLEKNTPRFPIFTIIFALARICYFPIEFRNDERMGGLFDQIGHLIMTVCVLLPMEAALGTVIVSSISILVLAYAFSVKQLVPVTHFGIDCITFCFLSMHFVDLYRNWDKFDKQKLRMIIFFFTYSPFSLFFWHYFNPSFHAYLDFTHPTNLIGSYIGFILAWCYIFDAQKLPPSCLSLGTTAMFPPFLFLTCKYLLNTKLTSYTVY